MVSQIDYSIRVLVVDDDEGMVSTLQDILSTAGYAVDAARSGPEAVECVRRQRPDCILMDVRMPGLNGVEAIREIKRLAPASSVIFMTAYASSSLVEEAWQEGAVEVIPKPLDLEKVLHLIDVNSRRTSVLVVDDDPAFCHSLAEALALQSFDVHSATSADQALVLFEREPRQVVILDMHLDGASGLDVLLSLQEVNPDAIVILMTGFPEYQVPMRQGLSMAAACLNKPFEVDDLVRTIRRAVDRRRRGLGKRS